MYFKIIIKTIILYFYILLCYRVMGKKEIGKLNIIDLIVSFLIADMASISIEEDKSVLISIIPIFILVLLEIFFSYISMKSKKAKDKIEGEPSLIINKGKINFNLMKKLRYTLDDLLTHLRKKDIVSLKDVNYALLETDGTLSIADEYPLPIILDSKVNFKALKNINKDINWLNKILKDYNLILEEVFYAFYSKGLTYIITYDDMN